MLYMQEKLRDQRGSISIMPYRQTTSRQNHVIERIWVEVNQRVSYPLKRAVRYMENQWMIDTESKSVKFCLSIILIRLCAIGVDRFTGAWKNNHLPLRGIPNVLQSDRNGTSCIHSAEIATVEAAAADYRQQGGHLSDPRSFGTDPLSGNDAIVQQREVFKQRVHNSFVSIFADLIA